MEAERSLAELLLLLLLLLRPPWGGLVPTRVCTRAASLGDLGPITGLEEA